MKVILFVLAALLTAAAGCGPRAQPTTLSRITAPATARVVGYYFAPTVRRGFPVSAIKGELLTHVNYAFAAIRPDGSAALASPCLDIGECAGGSPSNAGGNFAELRRLKERFPHLRTLISFGGWGGSKHFSDAAATSQSRERFIQSALDVFIRQHPGVFDGIDLDWEYPVRGGLATNSYRPDDRENLTQLALALRAALDEQGRRDGKRYLLTIAAPAGAAHLANFDMVRLSQILDFSNIMTYDYHTAGRSTHFNSPLDAAHNDPTPNLHIRATMDHLQNMGIPSDRLVVGVPFYGYGYGGVPPENNGLFQPVERNGFEDTTVAGPRPAWVGAVRFYQIKDAVAQGFRRFWENQAKVPWLYNGQNRTWITYDDAESIGLKADFVRERGFGGVMIWELSGDDGTLLPAIHARLNVARASAQ